MGLSVADRSRLLNLMCMRRNFTVEELNELTGIGRKEISAVLSDLMRDGKVDHDPPSGHGWGYFVTRRGLVLLIDEARSIAAKPQGPASVSTPAKL